MKKSDKVTPELRREVLMRDGMCFAARLDQQHVCFDTYGTRHDSADVYRLTLDHVHDGYGMRGKRAPSDKRHLVAMCGKTNVDGPSKVIRQAAREYLRNLYG